MKKNQMLLYGLCVLAIAVPMLGCGKKTVKNREPQETTQVEASTEVSTEITTEEVVEVDIQLYDYDLDKNEFTIHTVSTTKTTPEDILQLMQKNSILSSDIKIINSEVLITQDNKKILKLNCNEELLNYIRSSNKGTMVLYSLANTYITNLEVEYVSFEIDSNTLVYNDYKYDKVEFYEPDQIVQINYNEFTKVFEEIQENNTSAINTHYSPVMFKHDLAILYNCVNDSTKTMIADYKDPSLFDDEFSQSDFVKFSNALFYNNPPAAERKLNKTIETNLQKYRMMYLPQNYQKNQTTVDEINNFISNQTNKKITNVVDKISQNDNIYLVSTLDMNITFKQGFTTETEQTITDFTNQQQTLKMLNSIQKCQYLSSTDAEGCIIDLVDDYQLIAILPKDNINFSQIDVNNLILNSYEQNMSITIPKIEATYTQSFNKQLENLLPSLITSGAGYNVLFEGVVDEIGFENAQYAISINIQGNAQTPDETLSVDKEIKFNKPFYYMIINSKTNEVILVGQYGFINN